ncbi:MAG: hypothetical protein F4Y28_05370 [Acidimicrobiia bacterium]|nr:hypothetical protein [Acidimicrobiia bacterium]MYG58016.1 hypothetical protein [Acidimicrobiia bacterium]MYJ33821.1 hypothetical protein [Acidimicrobiia bacterium]
MSSTSTHNPLAALDPHVAGPLEEVVQALDGVGLDPGLLELCAARIGQMIGGGASAESPQGDRERVVLAFTEQYVLDAHGVTDELCAELNAHLSAPELAALTTAIATFEALARSRAVLKGVME